MSDKVLPEALIEELLTAAGRATPGEWVAQSVMTDGPERGEGYIVAPPVGGLIGAALPQPTEMESGDFSRVVANAAFIALANPQTISALIAEVKAARAGAVKMDDPHRFGSPPEPVVNPSEAWCDAYAAWYYQEPS